MTNSTSATSGQTFTLSGAEGGAYVHDIAINPDNADELMVVISNYNTESLFYSTNGGQNFTAVQGNLSGVQQTVGLYTYWTGPSIRSATILPTDDGLIYIVGTSTGVYSTKVIDGDNTVWDQESNDFIGNTVTEYLESREADATVVVGTHGRGIFIGQYDSSLYVEGSGSTIPKYIELYQNYPNPFNPGTTIKFYLSRPEHIILTVFDVTGREIAEVLNQSVGKGTHTISFNAGNLTSGIYFYTLKSGSDQITRKMMVLK